MGNQSYDRPDFAKKGVLPNSLPRDVARHIVWKAGVPYVPIYCANCGCDGGWIPEDAARREAGAGFAFYLCVPCSKKWGHLADTMLMPDEVFWERVKQTQLEAYGRELTADEVLEALKNPNHPLTKLAKDRYT